MHIKNIIFDFGFVLLGLNEQATVVKLAELLDIQPHEVFTFIAKNSQFYKFECGEIDADTFLNSIIKSAKKPISKNQIIDAWNAMLLDFPIAHIELLINLKSKYRTFLLSNTNIIHQIAFEENMKKQGIEYSMHDLFEQVWYSHTIHMRKPHVATYKAVLEMAQINANETIFLDDKLENIEGAQKAGLHTIHITETIKTLDVFNSDGTIKMLNF